MICHATVRATDCKCQSSCTIVSWFPKPILLCFRPLQPSLVIVMCVFSLNSSKVVFAVIRVISAVFLLLDCRLKNPQSKLLRLCSPTRKPSMGQRGIGCKIQFEHVWRGHFFLLLDLGWERRCCMHLHASRHTPAQIWCT